MVFIDHELWERFLEACESQDLDPAESLEDIINVFLEEIEEVDDEGDSAEEA